MKITGKKILITGGASGIGFGMAEQFVKDENTVIICGRRKDVLQEAGQKIPGLLTSSCDLSTATGRIELYSWISKEHDDLQILVNNAGIQQWMAIDEPDFNSKAEREIAINIGAAVHLSSLFINLKMLETIMNVTSGLAFVPLTKAPVYCATKAFMHSFTLSQRKLLDPRNIDVIEIIPPALNTDLGGKGIHDFAPPVKDFIEAIFMQMEQGKKELTFGFSEHMVRSGPDELAKAFERMNNS